MHTFFFKMHQFLYGNVQNLYQNFTLFLKLFQYASLIVTELYFLFKTTFVCDQNIQWNWIYLCASFHIQFKHLNSSNSLYNLIKLTTKQNITKTTIKLKKIIIINNKKVKKSKNGMEYIFYMVSKESRTLINLHCFLSVCSVNN